MMDRTQGQPVGYQIQPLARRVTRPLRRRKAIVEAAEAMFTKKPTEKPIECPTKN